MDQPTATLIAALVAGAVAGLNFVFTISNSKKAEVRTQFRELLKPSVVSIGECLHQILACAQVALRRIDAGQDPMPWIQRTKDACTKLMALRAQVKYPLWGLDDAIRELSRLGGWLEHHRSKEASRSNLVAAAEDLRNRLDATIRQAYLAGKPPSLLSRWRVRRLVRRLRMHWKSGNSVKEEPDDS